MMSRDLLQWRVSQVLLVAVVVGFLLAGTGRVNAVELDDVYRLCGPYHVATAPGLLVYFPTRCETAMTRVVPAFAKVRENLAKVFGHAAGDFTISVLLTDHDDRDTSALDPTFDLVTLGLFEETDSLSTRGYSLEQKFALRLAYILILRELGPAKMALRRRIAMLSVPPWFIEGLAMHYAFPMDPLHSSRLIEMARRGRLFSVDDLDKIIDQDESEKDRMRFQARHMLDFWHERAGEKAGLKFLEMISKRPAGFAETFRAAFGMSFNEAMRAYRERVTQLCHERNCDQAVVPEPLAKRGGGAFAQGLRQLPDGREVWVSARRYREEVYDLYSSTHEKPVMRNVHPRLWVDPQDATIFVSRYQTDRLRQRRLSLWAVPASGSEFLLDPGPGAFRPLGKRGGRLFYSVVRDARTWICSIDPQRKAKRREECQLPAIMQPLDLAFDAETGKLLVVLVDGDESLIARCDLSDPAGTLEQLYRQKGMIRGLGFGRGRIWFAAEGEFRTLQLCSLGSRLVRHTMLPGGVWDFELREDGAVVTTIVERDFRMARVELPELSTAVVEAPFPVGIEPAPEVKGRRYRTEYHRSYWLPRMNRDSEGSTLGIYSYQSDRLDRSRLVVSPTYGLKSKNWGYVADYMHRFDLLKAGVTIEDRVIRKSYRSDSYYERVRSSDLHVRYPFALSTTITVGANQTDRGIDKYPERVQVAPTVGQDNSLYVELEKRAIKTEPFWEIFPRQGREIRATWRKGLAWFGGGLRYDSRSLRWSEFVPVTRDWVLTLRGWIADDEKQGDIRRPDDLSLGGSDFLRGYEGSVRYGDALRVVSLHLGHPIPLALPALRKWVEKEILIGEIFWERGDVKPADGSRRFAFLEDRGVELRGKALILRRIPMTLRMGTGWPSGGTKRHSYWSVDFSALTGLIQ